MPGVGFILIPFDGSREMPLSASEAKSQQVIDDPVRETRLSELLDQRGLDVKFMFTNRGVLIRGTEAQALTIGRLVEELPNLAPSEKAPALKGRQYAVANDDRARITGTFGAAAHRAGLPAMRANFTVAANDAQVVTLRGRRPAITGSHGVYALAA